MSKAEVSCKWDLKGIVFIGRVWDEYMRMFNITKEELIGRRILDCPAGACAFTALSNQIGINVTACDIAYFYSIEALELKGLKDIEITMSNMKRAEIQENFLWDYFKSLDDLEKVRKQALNECITDMEQFGKENRYVPAILPSLPFDDNEFEMTLSANFLFLYADRLDYEFHLKTIRELMRVTSDEIRIFPTVDFECQRYIHMDKLLHDIHNLGWITEETKVPYEFQKNTNTMLKLINMI